MARMSCGLVVVALAMAVFCLSVSTASAQEGEKKVSIDQVPKAVKKAILKEVGDGKLIDIGEVPKGRKKIYEIEMHKDGKEIDVVFDSNGKVLLRRVEGLVGQDKDEGEEEKPAEKKKDGGDKEEGKAAGEPVSEKKVTIDQVPEKVKKAILKEVGKGKLVDIGVITDGAKKFYEIEVIKGGKEFDVLFDSNGKRLKKTFEGFKRKEKGESGKKADKFQDSFDLENRKFSTKGRNKYLILEPGYQLVLEGKEGEHEVKLAVTVLDETKKIGDIETRVVEERETVDGELVEISRNFFAICKKTKSVFYFGEEVDIYKDGKIIAHEGAWLHGEKGARAGMMMPGEAVLGARYYQEVAPKMAMDRAKIVSTNTTLTTPAGKFTGCLKCQEENPLDKEKEFKIHAPGIGLVQDEDLLLTKYGFVKK